MINIGNAIKEHRKAYGISQTALAKETQISQQNISRWENNTHVPNIIECIQLADFYEITLDELIGRDYERTTKK